MFVGVCKRSMRAKIGHFHGTSTKESAESCLSVGPTCLLEDSMGVVMIEIARGLDPQDPGSELASTACARGAGPISAGLTGAADTRVC